jgi:hypothetical protein
VVSQLLFRAGPVPLRRKSLESPRGPVNPTQGSGAGSRFFSVQGARRDRYRVYLSDERRGTGENRPRPEGLRRKSGAPGDGFLSLRRKSGHTSFSPSTVDPPQPSGSASSPPHGRRPVRGGPGSGRIFPRKRGPRCAVFAHWGRTPSVLVVFTGPRCVSGIDSCRRL